jgi:hypothetical protein
MNEMLENWSLRWHSLQRSLAAGPTFETEPLTAAVLVATGSGSGAAVPPTWLARARIPVRRMQINNSAGRGR